MECKCGKKAVIFRDYEGRALCRNHFLKSFEKKVIDNIRKEKLIGHGDRIAVGLSGGKDSSALLHILKKHFGKRKDLAIFAILIDEGIHGYRDKSIVDAKRICEKLDIKLHIFSYKDQNEITIDKVMTEELNEGLSACHYCGVFRRDLLNRFSRELKATKLAIGHNLDDEVQAIMMNYLKGDLSRLARLGFKTKFKASEDFVLRIKPFRNIPEREIGLYAVLNDIGADFSECPYAKDSLRFEVRDFINDMEDKHPTTKFSILNMFDRMHLIMIKMLQEEGSTLDKIKECSMCGEPCAGEICRRCELLLKFKKAESLK